MHKPKNINVTFEVMQLFNPPSHQPQPYVLFASFEGDDDIIQEIIRQCELQNKCFFVPLLSKKSDAMIDFLNQDQTKFGSDHLPTFSIALMENNSTGKKYVKFIINKYSESDYFSKLHTKTANEFSMEAAIIFSSVKKFCGSINFIDGDDVVLYPQTLTLAESVKSGIKLGALSFKSTMLMIYDGVINQQESPIMHQTCLPVDFPEKLVNDCTKLLNEPKISSNSSLNDALTTIIRLCTQEYDKTNNINNLSNLIKNITCTIDLVDKSNHSIEKSFIDNINALMCFNDGKKNTLMKWQLADLNDKPAFLIFLLAHSVTLILNKMLFYQLLSNSLNNDKNKISDAHYVRMPANSILFYSTNECESVFDYMNNLAELHLKSQNSIFKLKLNYIVECDIKNDEQYKKAKDIDVQNISMEFLNCIDKYTPNPEGKMQVKTREKEGLNDCKKIVLDNNNQFDTTFCININICSDIFNSDISCNIICNAPKQFKEAFDKLISSYRPNVVYTNITSASVEPETQALRDCCKTS